MAAVAGFDEQLSFFDQLMCRLRRPGLPGFLMGLEEIRREFAAHKRIEENLRVVKLGAEVADDLVRIFGRNHKPELEQRLRPMQHGFVRHLRRLFDIPGFQLQLSLVQTMSQPMPWLSQIFWPPATQ